ncbi:uncharacterized protein TM35_000332270 [Trypanosoma theileri]|uniref:Uncharacterized protein n=1 Tax=Trypanosoma theileri TaxID=67003 RepID=A0A1X0NNQ6_9TRYP|nr:uncharacterized protein TM35_000332270 [Trypanosoma theileri]ORC85770.1 hypothetical protein TM35_000332270 [Trypanosoma theileri]
MRGAPLEGRRSRNCAALPRFSSAAGSFPNPFFFSLRFPFRGLRLRKKRVRGSHPSAWNYFWGSFRSPPSWSTPAPDRNLNGVHQHHRLKRRAQDPGRNPSL